MKLDMENMEQQGAVLKAYAYASELLIHSQKSLVCKCFVCQTFEIGLLSLVLEFP